jgi:hypothetical protein
MQFCSPTVQEAEARGFQEFKIGLGENSKAHLKTTTTKTKVKSEFNPGLRTF